MSYATLSDVLTRFKHIGSMIGTGSSDVTSVEVDSVYIAQAEGLIDGFLANRYVTPVSPVPPLITMLCADLSVHGLLAERSGQVPDFIEKRYERCMDLLAMLRDGEMVLPSSVTLVSSQGDNFAWSPGQGYHGIFSPLLNELNQAPDQERVEAELNDRETDPGVEDACDH